MPKSGGITADYADGSDFFLKQSELQRTRSDGQAFKSV